MNPYESIQLPNVINAAGKMTYLGSSAVLPHVAKIMAEASRSFVDMAQLKMTVQRKIAEMAGAEASCVTSCAAAGIVVSVAAALTGADLDRVEALPIIKGGKREVIVQKGHVVSFGANLTQMIRMTGAEVKEIGTVNGVKPYHLQGALTEAAAAVVYVVSHHAVSNEMLNLREVVEIAAKHGIPVIVDAAAEVDLRAYLAQGADGVIYSGHKAIGGPTSGLIIGRKSFIEACCLQEKGYARAMKIGKESIMGLYASLEAYLKQDSASVAERYVQIVEALQRELSGIPGAMTKVAWDATRPIPRLQLMVSEETGWKARQLIRSMEEGNPSIRTRNHLADEGIVQFDPRELRLEETAVIGGIIRSLLQNKEQEE